MPRTGRDPARCAGTGGSPRVLIQWAAVTREQRIADHERRFQAQGLPLLIEDYSASEDVFNRAFPLLALIFVAEILGSFSLQWPLWANALAVAGSVALATLVIALLNRHRGRGLLTVPDELGRLELAAFVIVPALPQLATDLHGLDWLATAAGNLAVLLAVLVLFGFRAVAIVRWAARHLLGQLATSLALLSKALPLLVLFAVVLFLNTEVWQTFAQMPDASLIAVAIVIAVVAGLFIGGRVPSEVREMEAAVAARASVAPRPLSRIQRLNVGLLLVTSYWLQVLLVTAAIVAFFVGFGTVAVLPATIDAWIGSTGTELYRVELFGAELRLTEELLRVAAAIGALSGLYFAVTLLTDSAHRTEFLRELTDDLERTFADRAEYLALLDDARPASSAV